MAKLGSSLTLEGPGLVPAQDHRPDIDLEKRATIVAVRVIDQTEDFVRYHIDDEELRGYVHGLSVWGLDDRGATRPQPCVVWRHAWPSIIEEFGDADLEEPPPPDAFPSFPSTPGAGGSWTPGSPDTPPGVVQPSPTLNTNIGVGGNSAPSTWQRL
jgi:hypothetical protein